jgi:hypothetical protein
MSIFKEKFQSIFSSRKKFGFLSAPIEESELISFKPEDYKGQRRNKKKERETSFAFYMPISLHKAIKKTARKRKISMRELIVESVVNHLGLNSHENE